MAEQTTTTDATVDPSTTTITDPHEAPLPEGTKEETAKRFKDLLEDRKATKTKLAEFEALGVSPQDITAMRDQMAEMQTMQARLQELESARDPGERKTDEQRQLEQTIQAARAEFFRLFPEMKDLLDRARTQEEQAGNYRESLNVLADQTTAEILKEHGQPTTVENVAKWGKRLLPYIQDDPQLRAKFFGGDPAAAVKGAYEQMLGETQPMAERRAKAKLQTDKERLTALPRPHTGPGGSGTPQEAPKTLRDGVARAMARFGNSGG